MTATRGCGPGCTAGEPNVDHSMCPTHRQSLAVDIDQLVYARQREWSSLFGHNKLALRNKIYDTVKPYAELCDEHQSVVGQGCLICEIVRLRTALLKERRIPKAAPATTTPDLPLFGASELE